MGGRGGQEMETAASAVKKPQLLNVPLHRYIWKRRGRAGSPLADTHMSLMFLQKSFRRYLFAKGNT